MIEFDIPLVQTLGLLSGILLPVLVGLVTTKVTNSGLKAILLAGLAIVINLLTEIGGALDSGEAYNLGNALVLGLGTFVIAVTTHYGFWKPTAVTEKVQEIGATSSSAPKSGDFYNS